MKYDICSMIRAPKTIFICDNRYADQGQWNMNISREHMWDYLNSMLYLFFRSCLTMDM